MKRTVSTSFLSWALLLILSLIWGSSFILIKKGLVVFDPIEVGALRILAAAGFLAPVAIANLSKLSTRYLLLLLLIGFMGSLGPSFLFAIAQTKLDSSVTGMLNALTPLFTILMGASFFGSKLQARQAIGVAVGFIGSATLILAASPDGLQNINLYAFLVVGATICYGVNLNVIKTYLAKLRPLVITSVSLFLVGPLAVLVLILYGDIGPKLMEAEGAWLAFSYLVILGVVGTALALVMFNRLVQISNPLFASSVTYIIPIVAVIWGVIDGEMLQSLHYLAMVLIILGVWVANRKT